MRVSIKLANGKAINRKYNKTDKVRCLFAVAVANDSSLANSRFDLVSRFPARNLGSFLDASIAECDLAGAQIFYRAL